MTLNARRLRARLAAATAAALLAALPGGPALAVPGSTDAPIPGLTLPAPAVDVSSTDSDLAATAREVVVVSTGTDGGPEVTKLRARSVAESRTLASALDALPGVAAAPNRAFTLPEEPARGAGKDRRGSFSLSGQVAGSAVGGAPVAPLADEPYGTLQWGMSAVGAEAAWTVTHGAGVTVAVIDSGVDAGHPDLAGHVRPQVDVVADGRTGAVSPHGTHVAGIVAAALNGVGVAGLADRVTILPVRIFDASGVADDYTLAQGIVAAIDGGAKVISMSLGGEGSSVAVSDAVRAALGRGITLVAAGGNEHEQGNPTTYPAAYPGVLGVSSVNQSGDSSWFANSGPYIDLTAPGEQILSTVPGGAWGYADGTSMATPFVAATAALVRAANPRLTGTAVVDTLTGTAVDDASGDGRDDAFGYGLVRADRAVREAAQLPGGIRSARAVSVSVARAGYGNVLRVDVDPDRGAARYAFRVQRRTGSSWTTLAPVYRTEGSSETRAIALGAGTFRVQVTAGDGFAAATSPAVRLTRPTVRVTVGRNAARSKLRVNVDPDLGPRHWTFRVQKRTSAGAWRTLTKKYRTRGAAELRTVNLKRGTYRVVVGDKHGYRGTASGSATLVR